MKTTTCHCDKEALRANARTIRQKIATPYMLAVVKANAYGHGLEFAVNALNDLVDGFAVTHLSCAKIIRTLCLKNAQNSQKPILLMAGAADEIETQQAAELNLQLAVHQSEQLSWIKKLSHNANLSVFVKVNSGMNRLGFTIAEAATAIDELNAMPQVTQVGLMSHFANADSPNGIHHQLACLQPLRDKVSTLSLSNSAAALLHQNIGDQWARVGIALYGSSPAPAWQSREQLGLRAVMTLQSSIIAVQNIQTNDAVGYGATWRANKPSRIGIVACGYDSGYPQHNQTWQHTPQVFIESQPVPVVGRPSMEMLAVDLSDTSHADIGSVVELWGDTPSVDEVAMSCNRLSYDLLCAAGKWQHNA